MTKRLIDVDDAKLDEVRALLGTSTAKATVNGALDEVIALATGAKGDDAFGYRAEFVNLARLAKALRRCPVLGDACRV